MIVAENKRRQKSKQNIQLYAGNWVCRETTIHLSDVKLKTSFSNMYERALNDSRKFSIWKFYQIPFSIAGTLMLSLLTCDFKAIFGFSETEVEKTVAIVMMVSIILGTIMVFANLSKNNKDSIKLRDEAVECELKSIMILSEGMLDELEKEEDFKKEETILVPV